GSDLVPGGAAEQRLVVLRRKPDRGRAGRSRAQGDASELRRARGGRVAGDRPRQQARRAAGGAGGKGAGGEGVSCPYLRYPRRNGEPVASSHFVIASGAKQSRAARTALDCFVASLLAMTKDESNGVPAF